VYINNTINIDVKIKPKEIFFLKLKLLLNSKKYGFFTGISIFGLIYYIDLFLRNDIISINIIQEITSHFPGSVIALVFPVVIGSTIINIYSKTKKELKISNMYTLIISSRILESLLHGKKKTISHGTKSLRLKKPQNIIIFTHQKTVFC